MIPGRINRVSALIKKELSLILQQELSDPRLSFATVMHVDVAKDIRSANVYVSVMGTTEEKNATVEILNHAHHYIQDLLSKRIYLRYLPTLQFKLDNSLEYSEHIEQILKDVSDSGDETGD